MARKRKGMTQDELARLCEAEINDAIAYDDTEWSADRARAIEYFFGEMKDTPAQEGRSQVVSHDVADTIGWILPGLMRVFLASDRVAVYQPTRPGDEPGAEQSTDYINYIFLAECDGYRVLWDALHDALLLRNGIIKHWWDDAPEYETVTFTGLDDDAFTMLVMDDEIDEVLEHTEYTAADGSLMHDVKVSRICRYGTLRIESVPPEEFLIERDATSLEDANFKAHRRRRARGELIAEGFDAAAIMELPAYNSLDIDETRTTRMEENEGVGSTSNLDPLREEVEIYECYIKCDYDGDNILEWRRVVVGGSARNKVLANEEASDDVFTDLTAERVPHRWQGRSVFDDTHDVQRIKTVLLRQTLDNLYLSNNPQRAANLEQVNNPDVLFNPSIGDVIDVKGDPNAIIRDMTIPFFAEKSFSALEYMDQVIERRTGVSRSTMGLDPEALTNQTATAVQAQQSAAYSKIELMARNMAEMGLKRLFKCLLKIIVRHQDKPRTIRLRDQWVTVDPRPWNANMDVSIDIGLGSGSRDRDMQMLNAIALKQEQIIAQLGPMNPLVTPAQYRNTLAKMIEAGGMRSPEQFVNEVGPEAEQWFQQQAEAAAQSNPQMAKVQADMQAQQAKLQADIQMKQAEAQIKAQSDRERAAADIQVQRERMQAEMALKRWEAEQQFALRTQEMQLEAELKRYQIDVGAQAAMATNIPRPE